MGSSECEEKEVILQTINSLHELHKTMPMLDMLRTIIADINELVGWYDKERTFGEDIALVHSELSEALEEFRLGNTETYLSEDEKHKPLGVPSEMADVLIRLLDMCTRYNIDLMAETLTKLKYNINRSYRHGDKAL